MSRYTILSDVHGNLEALKSVLDHMRDKNVEEIWFLGDVVCYGPDPGECIRTLIGQEDWPLRGVRGNNDQNIVEGISADSSRLADDLVKHHGVVIDSQRRIAIEATGQSHTWTLERLTQEERDLLASLEELRDRPFVVDGAVLVHASPCGPGGREGNYLRTTADAEEAFVCDEDFRIGFFGHTHHAGVFRQATDSRMYENVEHISFGRFAGEMEEFQLDGRRVLINPGSVGQPRDGNRHAAYAVYDTSGKGKIEFYRVEYPVDETIDKLRAICDSKRGGRTDLTSMVDVLVQRLQEAA
jgi:predicted phosphodiesterase